MAGPRSGFNSTVRTLDHTTPSTFGRAGKQGYRRPERSKLAQACAQQRDGGYLSSRFTDTAVATVQCSAGPVGSILTDSNERCGLDGKGKSSTCQALSEVPGTSNLLARPTSGCAALTERGKGGILKEEPGRGADGSALRLGRRGRRFKSGRPDWLAVNCAGVSHAAKRSGVISGRCKMVLPQPSKLLLRVRFPPPALDFTTKTQRREV